MQLDLFNKPTRTTEQESKGNSFITQLKERIESFSKNMINTQENQKNENDTMLINQIQLKNKTSLESSLKMVGKRKEICTV